MSEVGVLVSLLRGGCATNGPSCKSVWPTNPRNWCQGCVIEALEAALEPVARVDIYKAIDGERDYQDRLARNNVKQQQPLEHLAIIERICLDMKNWWYDKPGQPPMDFMRKIAAVAVRCMEQHGAPQREELKMEHRS